MLGAVRSENDAGRETDVSTREHDEARQCESRPDGIFEKDRPARADSACNLGLVPFILE